MVIFLFLLVKFSRFPWPISKGSPFLLSWRGIGGHVTFCQQRATSLREETLFSLFLEVKTKGSNSKEKLHMGQLIIHQEGNLLELSGFLLKVGDQVEILHLDSWLPGTVAHDQQGWYFRSFGNDTGETANIRLQTGLTARLTELS
jgi:hypothetical protein